VPDGGADRQRARPEHFRLLLQVAARLDEEIVDLLRREVERPVDEVLTELADRFGGANLHARPLSSDLPDRQPQQPCDHRNRAEHRQDDRQPPRHPTRQHPGEGRPQQRGDEDRHHQRDHEELQLDDEPDQDARRDGDDHESPRIRRRDSESSRKPAVDVGGDRALTQSVEERPARRGAVSVVGAAHPASLELRTVRPFLQTGDAIRDRWMRREHALHGTGRSGSLIQR
jgi:hypothetical protein